MLCIILVLTMVLPLTACQKKGKQTATIDKNTIYKEEMLDIKLPSNFNVYNCIFKADRIYFYGYEYNPNDWSGTSEWGSVKYDGSDMKINKIESMNSWIETFLVSDEGNAYIIYSESIEDYSDPDNYIYENSYYLKELDVSGKEVAVVNLKEKYGADWIRNFKELSDGNFLLITSDKFVILDKNLKEVKSKAYDSFDGTLYTLKDGSLALLNWEEGGSKLYRFDINKFEKGEEIQLPFSLANYNIRDDGRNYDFVLTDSTQLYVYNIGDSALTARMNYVNSDLQASGFSAIYLPDDTTIYGYYNYYDGSEDGSGSAKFGKYTKVDPETIADKKLLSLGCLWVNDDVRKRVIEFNKSNAEYRIVINDYSVYDTEDDWNAGVNKFNSDIASGQAPDIVIANDSDSIHNYITKGLFVDLTDYIKNDSEIDYDDIFPNLIKASSYNGKLYELVPSFTVSTLAGKKSVLGDRKNWTMEEFMQFKNSLQSGMSMFADTTRESMLYN
ncbi:MAG: extracellular solute-binding protein, partial [Lachnospiraceae bacterium]|nr:extracellular solute-binding protein [Lachnospiraceae bacterium]